MWFPTSLMLVVALPTVQDPVQGDRLAAPVRLTADGDPIDTGAYIGHSGPLLEDITGDGRPELLVGNFRGHVQVFANTSKEGAPTWEAKGLLQAAGADLRVPNW